jgi:hypothetical protein
MTLPVSWQMPSVSSSKKDPPSSGLFRVQVDNEYGMAQRNGTGMFPREVVQKPPGRFCQGARAQRAPLNRHPVPERVGQQVYLHPYPKELMLPNHVSGGRPRFHLFSLCVRRWAEGGSFFRHNPKGLTEAHSVDTMLGMYGHQAAS